MNKHHGDNPLRFPTGVTVAQAKKDAKKLHRELGVPLHVALDRVAGKNGLDLPWAQALQRLKPASAEAGAQTEAKPLIVPKSHTYVFHAVQIGSIDFYGLVSADGPYISAGPNGVRGGVCIGASAIEKFDDERALAARNHVDWAAKRSGSSYWVVKYSDEFRIDLAALNDAEVRCLSREFGLIIPLETEGFYHSSEMFLRSPAFGGLREWVQRHPKIAKEMSPHGNSYIPHWYELAKADDMEATSARLEMEAEAWLKEHGYRGL